ncbi:hypothetical protein [Kyrpidia spormannii]|nr:hypothetical protein [Kyrpidia spormannii]
MLEDRGDHFAVVSHPPLSEQELNAWRPSPGYPYLKLRENEDVPRSVQQLSPSLFDYEAERRKEAAYRERVKALGRRRRTVENALDEMPDPPDSLLPLMKTFNSMRMGSNAYNNLLKAIAEAEPERIRRIVAARLGFSEAGEDETAFAKAASTLQFYNPIAGKGIHRPKPDSTSPAGYPDVLTDWFAEWMKFRAMTLVLFTFVVGDDTKILGLAPKQAEPGAIRMLARELRREEVWGGNVRLDCLMALKTAQLIIRHSEFAKNVSPDHPGSPVFSLLRKRPSDVIGGLYQSYFKNLGTASAVMNVSFLSLPGWFPVDSREDAVAWNEILNEHQDRLRGFREDRSDHMAVLLKYRDFLVTGDLRDALEFFVLYAAVLMQDLASGKRGLRAFSEENMRRVLMSYDENDKEKEKKLTKVIDNPGFQAVARAIRNSTILPQYRKAMNTPLPVSIHYGLAQSWRRKAEFKEDFVKELCDFVASYNYERARLAEQGRSVRQNKVATEDLEEVIRLIDEYGSSLVGMLLVAFGHTTGRRDADAGTSGDGKGAAGQEEQTRDEGEKEL